MTENKCDTCGHVKESHNQVVIIQGIEHPDTCKSCTCIKYLSKDFMDAVRTSSQTRDSGKASKKNEDDERRIIPLMKYTGPNKDQLFEAVLLAGVPCFIRFKNNRIETFS